MIHSKPVDSADLLNAIENAPELVDGSALVTQCKDDIVVACGCDGGTVTLIAQCVDTEPPVAQCSGAPGIALQCDGSAG